MLVGQNLRELAARRQLLLAQSGLQRATLEVQLVTAAESLRWLDAGVRLSRRLGPWLIMLAPVAGLLAVRRSFGWWEVVRRALPLARAALGLLPR
jgi:hypothetical protein